MQSHRSPIPARKVSLVILVTMFLASMLYAGKLPAAQAKELPPVQPTPLEPKIPPPGMESLAADLSITATADAYESDNSVTDLEAGLIAGYDQLLTSGIAQTHSISPIGDVDWVKFHLDAKSSVTIQTSGANAIDDTELWLYNSSLQQLDYNDDRNPNNWHSYIQMCGPTALDVGDYYAKVDKRGNDAEIASYDISFTINPAGFTNCIPNTAVMSSGQTKGSYWVHPETATRQSFAGLNTGLTRVLTYGNVKPLVASMGISLKKTAGYESYTEFMGVPGSGLADTYVFPWYNNIAASGLTTQLCFGNVGKASTNVWVTIGALAPVGYYGLAVNKAKCVAYAGVNTGPVKVKSSGSVPIVASLITMMKPNAKYASYAEFGGFSAASTSSAGHLTDHMFPWYNDKTGGPTTTFLRYTNVGIAPTNVTVLVHGTPQWMTNNLGPNQSRLIEMKNLNDGPVHVQSSNSVRISVSMIVESNATAGYAGYSEFMGFASSAPADTRFVFPWYNNAASGNLVSQLRIMNVGITTTNVTVTIGGDTKPTLVGLGRAQSRVVSYSNINNGPVVVQSSGGVPILASLIVYLKKGPSATSYSEYIGQYVGLNTLLDGNQMAPTIWFPWYNNTSTGSFVTDFRFGVPAKP